MQISVSKNFIALYKKFIYKYVLKLIGETFETDISETFIDDCTFNDKNFELVKFISDGNELFFGIKEKSLFKIKVSNVLSDDDERLLRCIINKYFKAAIYNINGKKQHNYISRANEMLNYEYAIQSGICNWVVGDEKNSKRLKHYLVY